MTRPCIHQGAWPQFLGRTGTIIEVNLDRKRPRLTEFGVSFGEVTKALDGHRREFNWDAVDVAWFKAYEMAPLAAVRPAELQRTLTDSR